GIVASGAPAGQLRTRKPAPGPGASWSPAALGNRYDGIFRGNQARGWGESFPRKPPRDVNPPSRNPNENRREAEASRQPAMPSELSERGLPVGIKLLVVGSILAALGFSHPIGVCTVPLHGALKPFLQVHERRPIQFAVDF